MSNISYVKDKSSYSELEEISENEVNMIASAPPQNNTYEENIPTLYPEDGYENLPVAYPYNESNINNVDIQEMAEMNDSDINRNELTVLVNKNSCNDNMAAFSAGVISGGTATCCFCNIL